MLRLCRYVLYSSPDPADADTASDDAAAAVAACSPARLSCDVASTAVRICAKDLPLLARAILPATNACALRQESKKKTAIATVVACKGPMISSSSLLLRTSMFPFFRDDGVPHRWPTFDGFILRCNLHFARSESNRHRRSYHACSIMFIVRIISRYSSASPTLVMLQQQ